MKKALITGITGQVGSYLAEYLLEKDYKVVGLVRRSSVSNFERIEHLLNNPNISLVEGEVSDTLSVYSIVETGCFDEIYNLAAQSHVGTSFKQPLYTFDVVAKGPLNFLEAIKKYSPKTKFFQASTSELFGSNYIAIPDLFDGRTVEKFQDEKTAFKPQSPYAVAKLAAHDLVRIYRDGYGLYATAGIIFNNESPRRGEQFVTRKITRWIGEFVKWHDPSNEMGQILNLPVQDNENRLYNSLSDSEGFPKLRLGNVDAFRDWSHTKDVVRAMYLINQAQSPNDYVVATGKTNSVRQFIKQAFLHIGIENHEDYWVVDEEFYRPAEVEYLCGKPTRIYNDLGWQTEIAFDELVKEMVESDINAAKKKSQQATI